MRFVLTFSVLSSLFILIPARAGSPPVATLSCPADDDGLRPYRVIPAKAVDAIQPYSVESTIAFQQLDAPKAALLLTSQFTADQRSKLSQILIAERPIDFLGALPSTSRSDLVSAVVADATKLQPLFQQLTLAQASGLVANQGASPAWQSFITTLANTNATQFLSILSTGDFQKLLGSADSNTAHSVIQVLTPFETKVLLSKLDAHTAGTVLAHATNVTPDEKRQLLAAMTATSKQASPAPAPGTGASAAVPSPPPPLSDTEVADIYSKLKDADAYTILQNATPDTARLLLTALGSTDQQTLLAGLSIESAEALRTQLVQDVGQSQQFVHALSSAPSPLIPQLMSLAALSSETASLLRQATGAQISDALIQIQPNASRRAAVLDPIFSALTATQAQLVLQAFDSGSLKSMPGDSSMQVLQLMTPDLTQRLFPPDETDSSTLPAVLDSAIEKQMIPGATQQFDQYSDEKSAALETASQQESTESAVVNGIAKFIEIRARAEAEDFAIRKVLNTVCDKDKPDLGVLFPETCVIRIERMAGTTMVIGNSYAALVKALRDDFEHLPACAILNARQTAIGYWLQSIYEQNADGTNIDLLIYGLATSGSLNTLGPPGGTDTRQACNYTSGNGFEGDLCGVVVPMIAYAATLRAQYYIDKNSGTPAHWNPLDKLLAVHAFAVGLADLAQQNHMGDLKTDIYKWLARLNDNDVDKAAVQLYRISVLQAASNAKNTQLQLAPTATRADISNQLLAIGNNTLDEFYSASQIVSLLVLQTYPNSKPTLVDNYLGLISDLQETYAAIEAREYSLALARGDRLYQCFVTGVTQGYCSNDWSRSAGVSQSIPDLERIGGAIAALADAKSSDDFATTLDEIASPVDAWKFRFQDDMLALSAYGGLAAGVSEYDVPKYGNLDDWYPYSVFAPVGISYSTPSADAKSAYGVFLSFLDVGNIIEQPGEIHFAKGRITGDVDSKFAKVFTPGLYFIYSFNNSYPLSFFAGISRGPSNFRQVIYNDGTTDLVSRGFTFKIGIAFDIVILQFYGVGAH